MLRFCKNKEELLSLLGSRAEETSSKAEAAAKEIIENVRKDGDKALREYTLKFDKVELSDLYLSESEQERLISMLPAELYKTMEKAADNIRRYHEKQLQRSYVDTYDGKVLGQRIMPLERVGLYIPGGTASYPSTVLMNAIPAKVAGVKDLVLATPAKKDGISPAVAAAARICGVDKILLAGGAQGIAALAYGTESVKKVDKIVGPGNMYVAAAKRLVFGKVDIDMIAGPSEVLVIADEYANPEYVAADLLSQAEHDAMAAVVLLTDSKSLAEKVCKEVEKQLALLPRCEIAALSVNNFGCVLVTKDIKEACDISNEVAPEHLELSVKAPFEILEDIKNAGSVFLGEYSPEPLGDYFAGPNHVLPTNGTARFSSPLCVDSFMKKQSFLYCSRKGLEAVKDDVIGFAEYEGLGAHANSVRIRFKD
ncbi:MAG: histidinol dehydrogenase [Ruminococcaceae bacterium]|nr:histidinol dehydrogenase [Oscillospiraceae bacterium]